ncbi:MAG: ImmA/IrrE family metallo-endopeptidase [Sedimenticola sp.]
MKELGITEPEEIDLEAISYHCGASVRYRRLDGCAARIIGGGEKAIISVDRRSTLGRQRFSIGHELGHWVRDRGKATRLCQKTDLNAPWDRSDPESLANAYAADLLMPYFMFKPMVEGREVTLDTVREFRGKYQTSLTATAIRLVQFGSYPSLVVCHDMHGRRWYTPSRHVPNHLKPKLELSHETAAFEVLYGGAATSRPVLTKTSEWIGCRNAYRYSVHEQSVRIADDTVLSLLWWKDKAQFAELAGY